MVCLHLSQYATFFALKRIIFRLLNQDELTSEKLERIYLLGSERGFCRDTIQEIVLDCQVEYTVG